MKNKLIKYNFLAGALLLTLAGCSNLDESAYEIAASDKKVIYSETFESDLGDFTAVSVSGDQAWAYNTSKYAMMTGYVSSANNANEDWLISPEINLTDVASANVSFDHVTRYFANLASEATVWVSTDYVTGSLPATATWVQLTTKDFADLNSWTFNSSGQISLTAYAGKKVRVAFKYISTSTKAGTWEIKNFLVQKGEAVITVSNDGSEEKPYTVVEGIAKQTGISAWVKGYIVGYAWSGTQTSFNFSADTCTQATNILIADTNALSQIYLGKTMTVQLPAGAVRTGLNLKDNKGNFGKKVTLYGVLSAYFGVPGLKTVSYYKHENGTTGGTKPIKAIFTETFASSSQGAFTIQNVNLPSALTYIWTPTASYGMTASGFKVNDYASESWLISPAINLSAVTSATLTFDHALNYVANAANKLNYVSVWVSTNYQSGAPSSATWTRLTVPTYPAGTNWTFVSSGNVDMSSVAGNSNVRIAFKYTSIDGDAATWEVKNVLVY
jgi:hypothetical protein